MRPTASCAWLLHLLGELREANWLHMMRLSVFAMDGFMHQWSLSVWWTEESIADDVDTEKITTSSLAKI